MFAECSAPLNIEVRGFIPDTLWKFIRFGNAIVRVIPAVLTAPRLRALHVIDQVAYSEPSLSDGQLSSKIPPIPTSVIELRWTRDQFIFARDAQISDEAAVIRSLAFLLRLSVQALSLPIESAPIRELSTLTWPHLTDLSLTANRPSSIIPLTGDFPSIITNMPRLTVFSLMLPQASSALRSTIVFPNSSTTTPPLECLRSMTLAYPNPEDLIFDHLPASLWHLSLTDCPRHYLSLDGPNPVRVYNYSSPIITSSELRSIIDRCKTPALKSLEVVYQADKLEVETLGLIARKFSQLHTLKLFRYTSSDDDPVDATVVASALSPLKELRYIYVHLDNPRAPRSRPRQPVKEQYAVVRFWDGLQNTADIFANAFTPQLDRIYLLERYYWSTYWTRWSVRYGDGDGDGGDGGVDGGSGIGKEVYCCPYSEPDLKDEDLASDLPPDQIPSSIVELRWCRDQWSFATDAQISDEAAFIRALTFPLRLSLQTLSVPIESAPIRELSTLIWPQLTDLSIPRLWNLSVLLPQSSSFPRSTTLLPITSAATPPLESLQSLTLAYPNPADLIFDHLPPSLHHLSPTDCPRHYLLVDTSNPLYEYSYDSPILTSSELGGIVRRCDTPDLESLEVVYRADAAEVDTLGMIARRFSGIRTLRVFRYVDSADDPVDAVSIHVLS
ncbi:uncharacterized protein STEHIDRAFT_153328 [Stereum hirsutum FP-91666 SS1]|uniref:uncharacterized protein n=1 Tax=Stereum hirsutum (strain FP-91666) TaxID=721885 RepID=UPI000440BF4D|nr:uncharacterized protein STEHIDRAFT_153328 [Stereum hirsutum FP-91666 SS1]EIM89466.1 hypothetical protein STEHIDRAFT_153328 [Stereum hirsutum FP-91666 SS1]